MKTTIPTLILVATLCASVLVTRPARAQDYYSSGQMWADQSAAYGNMATMYSNQSQFISQQTLNMNLANNLVQSRTSNTGGKMGRKVRKTTPKKALTTTTYRESPVVHKQALTRFTNWLATQTNATDAESIRRDFESQDVMALWAKEVAKEGLGRGDVADAMACYWVTNWQIANRVTTDPKPAQVRAVRRFFVSVLSSTPAFAKATNAQRQEMAEGYIYGAVLQGGAFAQIFHTGDKSLIQRYSDGRAASFKKEMGFDLRTVRLTNAGFAARS